MLHTYIPPPTFPPTNILYLMVSEIQPRQRDFSSRPSAMGKISTPICTHIYICDTYICHFPGNIMYTTCQESFPGNIMYTTCHKQVRVNRTKDYETFNKCGVLTG